MTNANAPSTNEDTADTFAFSPTDRRAFLARAGLLGAWLPFAQIGTASAASNCPVLPAFPSGIPLYRQSFKNWAGDIAVDDVWTCAPRFALDVVQIVNWARSMGYKVRPRGMMHNWSPLTRATGATCAPVVLLDTTKYLTAVSIDNRTSPPTVTSQAGVTMEELLERLEQVGFGMTAFPAPGDVTLRGVLAIDGHGTAAPAKGEIKLSGHTYGSVSNQVLSLTAVVFDASQQKYVLRTFARNDPEIAPLLVHLERAFIVEAKLQVGSNKRIRCPSRVDIPYTQLFAPQGSGGQTFTSFMDSGGHVEAIRFPFTQHPWLKVWSIVPTKPLFSRQVFSPFNYAFSDNIPNEVSDLLARSIKGEPELTPLFGLIQSRVTGLDQPSDMAMPGAAVAPTLSALRPRPDHPEWDVAVWFDILTTPGTSHANAFYRETELWMLSNYSGNNAAVRPERSKGWGYSATAAWADPTVLGYTVPQAFEEGQPAGTRREEAHAAFNRHAPDRVFSSPLLDKLLP